MEIFGLQIDDAFFIRVYTFSCSGRLNGEKGLPMT